MVDAFASLGLAQRSEAAQQAADEAAAERQQPPSTTAAADALARAISELGDEDEVAAAAGAAGAPQQPQPQPPPQPQQQDWAELAGSPFRPAADGSPSSQQQPGWSLGETHKLGTAAALDGSALRQVESIPAVEDQALVALVEAMGEPEDLVGGGWAGVGGTAQRRPRCSRAWQPPPGRQHAGSLPPCAHRRPLPSPPPPEPQLDYYRKWQVELSACYLATEAAGFDAGGVAELTAVQDRMAKVVLGWAALCLGWA